MTCKRDMLTAAIMASTLGFGAPIVFAQNAPGGHQRRLDREDQRTDSAPAGSWCSESRTYGPTAWPECASDRAQDAGTRTAHPQPDPGLPHGIEPTIPGQPAPGLPQREPMPGGPGTIPEKDASPQRGSRRYGGNTESCQESAGSSENKGSQSRRRRQNGSADPTSAARFSEKEQLTGDRRLGRKNRGETRGKSEKLTRGHQASNSLSMPSQSEPLRIMFPR